ncbi:ArnT family glycosyltransferase [Actinomadura macrotermitis]|uniref:Glycosyltransferase RgtA/B/C/D-like domain-containing protein n=1 Tax=Actinomadura macrotermitis TaxID=2585200 RepID=A0A7K0BZQ5_9ACTN|nr:glycosyltransferase family 39 protein [Actinomadura macrotermitis]MQY06670.1 hypothetical protein [Actinomadura macrotermitis]
MGEGNRDAREPLPPFAAAQVLAVAAVLAGVLTALSARYGPHRDELYFLAAAGHPAWGYVDQPPLTPMIAKATTALFGRSVPGLRVAATLACAAAVVAIAAIARELGGGRRAQVLAAVLTAASGYVLGIGHMVSTATFDMLAWIVLSLLALRLLRTGDGRWWLPIGVTAGIAMQNKYLVVLLAAALAAAVALTGPRRTLRGPWPLAGVAAALLIALPNLWWQAAHGWPQLTVAGGISADDGAENRLMLVPLQIVYLSPLFVPVWVAGALRLRRDPALRWARALPPAYLLLCGLVLATGGKPYYALPLLIVLMAAGCAPLARWLRGGARWAAGAAALLVAAAMSALVALPLLPVSALAVPNAVDPEQGEQVGWPALARAAAAGWARIPAERRGRAVIFTENYGEAGAIAFYGPRLGLPAPYSGHMAFADWGPPPDDRDGPVLIITQRGDRGHERFFSSCRRVAETRTGVDNEEDRGPVLLCEGPHRPWSALWPELRHYY